MIVVEENPVSADHGLHGLALLPWSLRVVNWSFSARIL